MDKKCSLCGNIYKNRIFRGGYICADCADFIKNMDIASLMLNEQLRVYTKTKKELNQ